MKYELNCGTGEITVRELNEEELAVEATELAKNKLKEQKEAELRAEQYATKIALLEKLGITEEEAKLLLS